MSVAIYETVPVGAMRPSDEAYVQVWTSVTAPAVGPPRGMAALIVLPGFRRALNVRIYQTEDDVAIEDPATGIFGAGQNLDSAVQDFGEALRDHLNVLASDDTLSPALRRQLEILQGYFSTP